MELDIEAENVLSINEFNNEDEEQFLSLFEKHCMKTTIHQEGLKYVAGYVAYRFKSKYPDLATERNSFDPKFNEPDWISFISNGHLSYPSNDLLSCAIRMDNIFSKFHSDSLSKEDLIFDKVTKSTIEQLTFEIPYEVVHCLTRTRTYIRLRELNRKSADRTRSINKKMTKITGKKKF